MLGRVIRDITRKRRQGGRFRDPRRRGGRGNSAELRNCLETPTWLTRSVLKVLNGTDYFYEWRGDRAAVLRFVRVQDVGWYLEQIEGVDGGGVDAARDDPPSGRAPAPCGYRIRGS